MGASMASSREEEDEGRLKTMTWRRIIGSLPSLNH
ncbi:hypothetical protein A2U01_0114911, partial [Trifolium medium]|nr:hypothetical protein [Trifolium medium]